MSPKLPPMHLEPIARALQPRNLSRFQCLRQVRSASQTRYLSQSPIFSNLAYQDEPPLPRWAYTPKSMTAPVSLKKRRPNNNWKVNENPKDLDDFYTSLLGEGGDTLLPDEIKWLAVTHKSFDQGRRGYNDRLAFLGKRILDMQASIALLNRSDGTFVDPPDPHEREPFRYPGVDLLPRLTPEGREDMTDKARLAKFAFNVGLLPVLRWKPRNAENLYASGVETALSQAICAIIGALALQKGGEVAARLTKDRILGPLSTSEAE